MLQLNPALSFCEVDGRHVFLDLQGDRYFCLDGELSQSWVAACQGHATAVQVDALRARRLVVDTGGIALEPCPAEIATRSVLDVPAAASSWLRAAGHALGVARTRGRLRRESLAQVIGAFVQAKDRARRAVPSESELAAIVQDFSRIDLFMTTLDQCLSRSLALGLHLARRGYRPDLVLGVRLGPFRAHCWLECDGLLVNDRHERVRHHQPIRRL